MFRTILFIAVAFFAAFCTQTNNQESQGKAVLTSSQTLEIPKLLNRAEALQNGKEWDEVQNFYAAQSAKLRSDPHDYDALLKLAECFIQEARVTGEHPHYYPAALAMVAPVVSELETKTGADIKTKDLLFRALSHKSSIQLSLHDFAGAKVTAEKASQLNPYNAYIVGCLVDANVELGNYEEAVKNCDRMMSIRPDLRSYSRVSYLREIHGDPKGAIEAMKMAVEAGYPGYEQTEWARLQLGGLYKRYGKMKDAETQYNNSLQVRPGYPFATEALAEIEAEKGNNTKALELLSQAAEVIPEIGFYMQMAHIHAKMGNKSASDALLPQIEKMFEEDMAAGHNMSLEAARFQLELKGNPEKALEMLQPELKVRPENIDVNLLLAEIYLKMDKKAEAKAALAKATRTGSKNPELAKAVRLVD
jgi:tetratricopeptide (TPR) repeat protein